MSLRINLNTAALNAHRQLQGTDVAMAGSIERLSSGFRINRGADDPAGLAISENLRAQVSGLGQAIANSNDAVNMIRTAEGALAEVHSLLRTMRNLVLHASNTGANDQTALDADQTQMVAARQALDRIGQYTQFGTKKLLEGDGAGGPLVLVFQTGANANQTLTVSIQELSSAALTIDTIDVSTGGTPAHLQAIDTAISAISTLRSELGSGQKSLESNIASLGIAKENIGASESSIRDADLAAEMVLFTRNQILLQAGTAMLTQANAAPQALLSLLR